MLGALGRAQRQGQLDPNGLASMLGGEHAQQTQAAPDLMGMATKLLDRDHDGSIVNDIMSGVGGLFGKK